MADKRKLQTEIDRVLKQVSEHSEIFEDTYDKIQTATNSNQKEKFEAELKKEIKKLQKFREQIKSWLNSSDAKSMAKVLGETRKLIENQMERYRDLERDAKTKAYSNEGLDKRSKLDPEEQEKQDCRDDLNRYIEDIKLQVDMIEAEIETTSNAKRKKKTEEVLEALQARIERHQRLVAKIEMVIRGLDNNNLEPSQLEDVKEGIEYHINDNTDPDFVEDEYLFDDIEEHLRAVGVRQPRLCHASW
ncbi:uncharacterized protein MONBRDRAFT_18770 [Monosiga brevicollis MX1]|uniref:CCR4-Not complex component Not N-terminal domain-containing protein n=1 Tax=Monosiga brevicollis TaxID=81824 RepID=A9UXD1_MONBE|nr:uncharacterized protein MONBRDRAFT_18770 [Monosiga brevicollis MX1]EDQ90367.1 predicted protein [Monosiga brevicollis MX1]|eukprot:XP_001745134.1 hypothetical protein [Monosiga brevicollis MX1]